MKLHMKLHKSFKLSPLACCVMLMLPASHSFAAQDTRQNIDIPAQNIESALLELAQESETQILFSSAITQNITTRAISANLTVEEALAYYLKTRL